MLPSFMMEYDLSVLTRPRGIQLLMNCNSTPNPCLLQYISTLLDLVNTKPHLVFGGHRFRYSGSGWMQPEIRRRRDQSKRRFVADLCTATLSQMLSHRILLFFAHQR
jgi:hypothetical protein